MSTVTRERTTRIGASDAAAVLGLSPYQSPYELWMVKTKRVDEFSGNSATKTGTKLESLLLDEAESDLGDLMRNVFVPGPGDVAIGATLDAQVIASGELVEAKTSGLTGGPVVGNWGEAGTDQIPEHYLVQVQVQMWCARSFQTHLYAYLGNCVPKKFCVQYDAELAKAIVEKLQNWWSYHVVNDIPPEQTGVTLELAKRLRKQAEKSIELSSDTADTATSLWTQIEELKAIAKQTEKAIESKQAELLLLLGDAEEAVLPNGNRFTYFESKRKGYTTKDTTYRTLRFKEKQ